MEVAEVLRAKRSVASQSKRELGDVHCKGVFCDVHIICIDVRGKSNSTSVFYSDVVVRPKQRTRLKSIRISHGAAAVGG